MQRTPAFIDFGVCLTDVKRLKETLVTERNLRL
jgi:hypothetical protein